MKSIFVILVLVAMTAQMFGKVSKQAAGTANGKPVDLYTLQDGKITVRILTYGGIVQSIEAPDRKAASAPGDPSSPATSRTWERLSAAMPTALPEASSS